MKSKRERRPWFWLCLANAAAWKCVLVRSVAVFAECRDRARHFGIPLAYQSNTRHPSREATMYRRTNLAASMFCLATIVKNEMRSY
jgi:hypothetical protein